MLKNVSKFTRPLAVPTESTLVNAQASSSTEPLPLPWRRPSPIAVPPPIMPTEDNPNPYDPSRRVRVFWDSGQSWDPSCELGRSALSPLKLTVASSLVLPCRTLRAVENMSGGKPARALRFLAKLKKLIGRPVDSIRMYEGQLARRLSTAASGQPIDCSR